MDCEQIIWFLQTEFQQTIEEGDYLFKKTAPEETPYVFKYDQRKLLEDLLNNEYLKQIESIAEIKEPKQNLSKDEEEQLQTEQFLIAAKMIVHLHLGTNYHETEENHQANQHFNSSLSLITRINSKNMPRYFNHLQELYNTFAILYINKDDIETGLGFLEKGQELYKSMEQGEIPKAEIINNSNNLTNAENQYFNFYYEGGISFKKTEALYTHTLFYFAQAYTKVDMREMAAQYCGLTMKRQYESGTYELKDFCVNCMSLADFYATMKNFHQAQYLILAALSILPDGKKKKMRASLEMSLGFMLFEYLKTSVVILSEQRLEESGQLTEVFNRKKLEFKGIDINIKKIEVKKDIEEVKSIFRQANTQFKKALTYFVLDGFVTEHIQIVEHQADMYKYLGRLELDPKKQTGLCERRLELLEPIFKILNKKAYLQTYEKLMCSIAEIYNQMFEQLFQQLFIEASGQNPKPKYLIKFNQYGEQVIHYYDMINQILVEDKETERNADYYNSVITAKFNTAKAFSRVYKTGRQEKVDYMVKSLNAYKWIMDYINKEVPEKIKESNYEFGQQYDMCQEMVSMLPAKIDKVNAEYQ